MQFLKLIVKSSCWTTGQRRHVNTAVLTELPGHVKLGTLHLRCSWCGCSPTGCTHTNRHKQTHTHKCTGKIQGILEGAELQRLTSPPPLPNSSAPLLLLPPQTLPHWLLRLISVSAPLCSLQMYFPPCSSPRPSPLPALSCLMCNLFAPFFTFSLLSPRYPSPSPAGLSLSLFFFTGSLCWNNLIKT